MGAERRAAERIGLRVPVSLRVWDVKTRAMIGTAFSGTTVDVSEGGLRVQVSRLPTGQSIGRETKLEVSFEVEQLGLKQPVRVSIAHYAPSTADESGPGTFGAFFTEINDADKRALLRFAATKAGATVARGPGVSVYSVAAALITFMLAGFAILWSTMDGRVTEANERAESAARQLTKEAEAHSAQVSVLQKKLDALSEENKRLVQQANTANESKQPAANTATTAPAAAARPPAAANTAASEAPGNTLPFKGETAPSTEVLSMRLVEGAFVATVRSSDSVERNLGVEVEFTCFDGISQRRCKCSSPRTSFSPKRSSQLSCKPSHPPSPGKEDLFVVLR